MQKVGIRELKNGLSAYVRRAEAGETILVTDRGRVVAELVPKGHGERAPDTHPGLLELARREGLRLPLRPPDPSAFPRMKHLDLGGRTIHELIDEERGDP